MKTVNFEFNNGHNLRISWPQDDHLDHQLNRADSEIYSSLMDILEFFGYDPTKIDEIKEVRIAF